MKKSLIFLSLASVVASVTAQDLRRQPAIGGFYLGMTNSSAAKIGLRDCTKKYSYSDITCVPTLPSLPGETEASVRFDAKSKKIVELWVKVANKVGAKQDPTDRELKIAPQWSASRWWQETDTLARNVVARLGIRCSSRWNETEQERRVVVEACYLGTVTQRVRRGYNEKYEASSGRHIGNEPHVQVLLTLVHDGGEQLYRIRQEMMAQEKKAASSIRDFEAGK